MIIYYLKRSIDIIKEKGIFNFSVIAYNHTRELFTKNVSQRITGKLDALGIIGPENIYSEDYYRKRKKDPRRSDTREVSNTLYEEFQPQSVIDFGCAIGTYLEPFYKKDVEIKGIDANESAFKHAVVPNEFLEYFDLRNEYKPKQKYDLVISIEVAEHLPKSASDNFVKSLTQSTNKTIVITAASPDQGGKHHINEQPKEYWIDKFKKKDFRFKSEKTEEIKRKINLQSIDEVKENLLIFEKER